MTPAKLAQVAGAARAPVSPAAFLDQMAADVGHAHVKRLAELRVELEAHARSSRAATIQPALERLRQALEPLDFSLLQPQGLWATMTGKSRNAGAGFAGRVEQIDGVAKAFAREVASVQQEQQAPAGAAERVLVEFEVEYRALDKVIDQGARWLQDMRNQLKTRQAEGGGPEVQQQIRQDSARCELLVARLKLLRAASTASQPPLERCRATLARRTSVLGALQQVLEGEGKAARERLDALADHAAGGVPAEAVDRARRVQRALQSALAPLLQDCAAVQAQDQAAADELAAMQGPLQAAA